MKKQISILKMTIIKQQQQEQMSENNIGEDKKNQSKYEQFINSHFSLVQPIKSVPRTTNNTSSIITATADKIYQAKKNTYRHYIRQIYHKINEEIQKKNNFLTIASQKLKIIDPSASLTTKEVKPLQQQQTDNSLLKTKRQRDKRTLKSLQTSQMYYKNTKQKVIDIKKETIRQVQKFEKMNNFKILSKTERGFAIKTQSKTKIIEINNSQSKIGQEKISQKRQIKNNKLKQRILSLNYSLIQKMNIRDYVPLNKLLIKREPFVCGLKQKQGNLEKHKEKVLFYIDFLWKINYSNSLFVKPETDDTVFKAYIGPGNNSIMVKSILKRRFWWTICDKPQNANFIWTQLKNNHVFQHYQTSSKQQTNHIYTIPYHQRETITQLNGDIEQNHNKIFNKIDQQIWQTHLDRYERNQQVIEEKTYLKRAELIEKKNLRTIENSKSLVVHNHFEQNFYIGNKKALFYFMKNYYQLNDLNVFQDLPLTFHVSKGFEDPQYKNFLVYFEQFSQSKKKGEEEHNIWILKPGQFSNRGNGITVCHSLDDIMVRIKSKEKSSDGKLRTFIIQKYIQKPLLYKSRKFDIRHYLLMTCSNGIMKAYWYPEGYIRTSSSIFTLKRNTNLNIHLTNDAVQKKSQQYGKYEKGNKISYQKFQLYLDKMLKSKKLRGVFYERILPQMKRITINAVKATYLSLDKRRKEHNFQLLGMDFMIDQGLKPWLIQINTNPCLELSCPLLARLIPNVLEQTFRICIDPLFPPSGQWPLNKKLFFNDNPLQENNFQLIFDESTEGQCVEKLLKGKEIFQAIGKVEQDQEVFQDDGQQEWQIKNDIV